MASDVAKASHECYAILKVPGKTEGLQGPRQELSMYSKGAAGDARMERR